MKELKSGKYVCIKDLYDESLTLADAGKEYELEIISYSTLWDDLITISIKVDDDKLINGYVIVNNEKYTQELIDRFNIFFIPLAEWREQQINSILE